MYSPRQYVEIFHLQFLRLLASGSDREHFTVKGGCNLRFFFGSVRYSEDLDLDLSVIARGTLKNKVERTFASPALQATLKAIGASIVDVSAPKQTDTTQRWKLGLKLAGQSLPVRTKVEFSRREAGAAKLPSAVEPVDGGLARRYQMTAPVVNHYLAEAALVQKIAALIGRSETQARDVFDLQLLHAKAAALPKLAPALKKDIALAVEKAMSLDYSDFLSQVVAYLEPEVAASYRSRAAWDAMQLEVVELLEALAR